MAKTQIAQLLQNFITSDLSKLAQDDGTQSASTGARSAENAADIKDKLPASVDETTPTTASPPRAGLNTPTNSIGTQASEAGEGVPPVKDKQDDPPTSSALKAANVLELGNSILADLAVATQEMLKQAEADTKAKKEAPATKTAEAPKAKKEAPVAKAAEASVEVPVAAELEKKDEEEATDGDMTLQEKAAAFDTLMGAMSMHNALATLMTSPSEQVKVAQVNQAERVKVAQAYVSTIDARARGMAHDYFSGMVGFMKEALAAGLDPLAEATNIQDQLAMAQASDPAAAAPPMPAGPAGPVGDPAAAGDPAAQLTDEDLNQIIQTLLAQGVTPEELLQLIERSQGAPAAGPEAGPEPAGPPAPEGPSPAASIDKAQAAASGEGADDAPKPEEKSEEKPKDEEAEKSAAVRQQLVDICVQNLVKAAQVRRSQKAA